MVEEARLESVYTPKVYRGFESRSLRQLVVSHQFPGSTAHVHGGPVGPPATIVRKLRQVRKEATVANDSGAGVWLAGPPPFWGMLY